jgi:predicted nucleic acid-binding protein
VTLVDAGPLVALIDADEPDHESCVLAFEAADLPLRTTWPAVTEAMYLLGRAAGSVGHQSLWRLPLSGRLQIADLSPEAVERSAALMDKYADRPMDLADATLVALAEEIGERRIITLDDDFQIYRIHGRGRFQLMPR